MEMADAIVINKADGNNIEKALLAAAQYRNALHLFPKTESGWNPEVLTYSGYYGTGVKEIFEIIDKYEHFVKSTGFFDYKRAKQSKYWMYQTIDEQIKANFYNNSEISQLLHNKERDILNNEISSFKAAQQVLEKYFRHNT